VSERLFPISQHATGNEQNLQSRRPTRFTYFFIFAIVRVALFDHICMNIEQEQKLKCKRIVINNLFVRIEIKCDNFQYIWHSHLMFHLSAVVGTHRLHPY